MNLRPVSIGEKALSLVFPIETARRLAPLGFALVLLLTALTAFGAWRAFDWFNDRDAVEDAANEANVEMLEELNDVIGEADGASDEARARVQAEIRETEELIDEALEKNCAVADYLASNGAFCLQPVTRVPGAAAE